MVQPLLWKEVPFGDISYYPDPDDVCDQTPAQQAILSFIQSASANPSLAAGVEAVLIAFPQAKDLKERYKADLALLSQAFPLLTALKSVTLVHAMVGEFLAVPSDRVPPNLRSVVIDATPPDITRGKGLANLKDITSLVLSHPEWLMPARIAVVHRQLVNLTTLRLERVRAHDAWPLRSLGPILDRMLDGEFGAQLEELSVTVPAAQVPLPLPVSVLQRTPNLTSLSISLADCFLEPVDSLPSLPALEILHLTFGVRAIIAVELERLLALTIVIRKHRLVSGRPVSPGRAPLGKLRLVVVHLLFPTDSRYMADSIQRGLQEARERLAGVGVVLQISIEGPTWPAWALKAKAAWDWKHAQERSSTAN